MTRSSDRLEQQTRALDPHLATTITAGTKPHAHGMGEGPLGRTYLVTLFVTYLVLLVWIVLWKLEPPGVGGYRALKLVPFAATHEAGASPPFDVLSNLVLFIPFGIYLGLLSPKRPWWKTSGVFTVASVALETMQYVLAVGRSDVSDVMVNTVGGLTGLAIVALGRSKVHARAFRALNLVCAMGTALALLATGLFLVSNVHIVHPGDVGPLKGTRPIISR